MKKTIINKASALVLTGIMVTSLSASTNNNTLKEKPKKGETTLSQSPFTEMGPGSTGGRVRVIVIDKSNSSIMYTGGVSGGLFKSTNQGSTWTPILVNDLEFDNQFISSMVQLSDGSLLIGTGEYFERSIRGVKNTGFIGGGIYKMNAAGTDITKVQAPSVSNSETSDFAFINELAASGNTAYAATNKGLYTSTDGGTTWSLANNSVTTNACDVKVKGTQVWVAYSDVKSATNSSVYHSIDGGSSYTQVAIPTNLIAAANLGRIEIAISNDDDNYVALSVSKPFTEKLVGGGTTAFNPDYGKSTLGGIVLSTNGASATPTFSLILAGGNTIYDPFSASKGTGDRANSIAFEPGNKNAIYVAGSEFLYYNGSWQTLIGTTPNPFSYVHENIHDIEFTTITLGGNPVSAAYVATDGGVFRLPKSVSGGAQYFPQAMNKGLNVTQINDLAIPSQAAKLSNQPYEVYLAKQVDGVQNMNGSSLDTTAPRDIMPSGLGRFVATSNLNPNVVFLATGSKSSFKSIDKGATLNTLGGKAIGGSDSIVAVYDLFESYNAPYLGDSLVLSSDTIKLVNVVNGANATNYTFTIPLDYPGKTQVSLTDVKMVMKDNGTQVATISFNPGATGLTNLISSNTSSQYGLSLTADAAHESSIDPITGVVKLCFQTALPASNSAPITVSFYGSTYYPANTSLTLASHIDGYTIPYTTVTKIEHQASVKIADPYKSSMAAIAGDTVYVTKDLHDFTNAAVRWYKVAQPASKDDNLITVSGSLKRVTSIKWSSTGKFLFLGTANGYVYRVKGLEKLPKDSICRVTQIAKFAGRRITSLAVDPTNDDNLLVTLGGYDQTDYVYTTSTATTCPKDASGSSNFVLKTGTGLTTSPVYSALYVKEINGTAGSKVWLGTEKGLFTCADIANPTWDKQTSVPPVPVYTIKQQVQQDAWQSNNTGLIYVGTHGRGVYYSREFQDPSIGIAEITPAKENTSLIVFPNPTSNEVYVNINITNDTKLTAKIYDVRGLLVKSIDLGMMNGNSNVLLNTADLSSGLYMIQVDGENYRKAGKVVISK